MSLDKFMNRISAKAAFLLYPSKKLFVQKAFDEMISNVDIASPSVFSSHNEHNLT